MKVQGSNKGKRLLVLAAVEAELADLRGTLPQNCPVELAAVGCGVVQAAINTAAVLKNYQGAFGRSPEAVVFIGSAGSYDHSIPLLTPAVASSVVLGDTAVSLGRGYFPEVMTTALHPDAALAESLLSLDREAIHSGTFATPLAITADRRLGTIIRVELGAKFENLELFGVASACFSNSAPWTNLSMVTNHIHNLAHKEWNQNSAQASKFTAAMIISWLSRTGILAPKEEFTGRTER